VVVSNDDLETLRDYIRPGITPVVFSNDLEWLDPAEAAERRNRLVKVIAQWRQDRESADPSRLARHYAEDFVSSNGQERREYLADIADSPAAGNMKVRLEDISIFGYPGYREMALISFTQRVYSTTSKFQDSESRRQQFWRKDDSGWQVIHEAESPDR
jgi:ketosteroid isomerase-like protein